MFTLIRQQRISDVHAQVFSFQASFFFQSAVSLCTTRVQYATVYVSVCLCYYLHTATMTEMTN